MYNIHLKKRLLILNLYKSFIEEQISKTFPKSFDSHMPLLDSVWLHP